MKLNRLGNFLETAISSGYYSDTMLPLG